MVLVGPLECLFARTIHKMPVRGHCDLPNVFSSLRWFCLLIYGRIVAHMFLVWSCGEASLLQKNAMLDNRILIMRWVWHNYRCMCNREVLDDHRKQSSSIMSRRFCISWNLEPHSDSETPKLNHGDTLSPFVICDLHRILLILLAAVEESRRQELWFACAHHSCPKISFLRNPFNLLFRRTYRHSIQGWFKDHLSRVEGLRTWTRRTTECRDPQRVPWETVNLKQWGRLEPCPCQLKPNWTMWWTPMISKVLKSRIRFPISNSYSSKTLST